MTPNYPPKPIYLDYHSTTPVDPRVAELMVYYLTTAFGNASSIDHAFGDEAEKAVSNARQEIAQLINASPKDIIFTSGATESINLAILGHIQSLNSSILPRIAVSPVEHKAVLDTCEMLAKKGQAELIYLKVDNLGRLDLEHLENTCTEGLSLLCVMAANNEIGNIYPLETIGQIAQQYEVPFFCDASQAVGKIPINFNDWGITYLAISAHKLYGPKGVGALVVRKGYPLEPIIFGGGHQKGLRSGTLNVSGIVGLGEACRLRQLEMEQDEQQIAIQRDRLQTLLQAKIPNLQVNGDLTNRLAGNLHIALPGIPNSAIIARIRHQLAISTGAACSSGVATPSHVLRALKLSDEMIEGALRIGVGKFTTDEEIDKAAYLLTVAVEKIRPYLL
jgi:cysteine desulfurase